MSPPNPLDDRERWFPACRDGRVFLNHSGIAPITAAGTTSSHSGAGPGHSSTAAQTTICTARLASTRVER